VIVNEAFARKFLHAAQPAAALGKQFRTGQPDQLSKPFTIVGVVETAKYTRLREQNSETAYYAESQDKARGDATIVIRVDGDPMALAPQLKQLLAEMHPASSVSFTRLAVQVALSLQRERVLAVLSTLFGGVALALAMLGLYGVMTYTVARRRNEIGVRIALGADRGRVLRLVLGDVARVVTIGLVVGAGGALASGRLVSSFLYGLSPNDPAILAAAATTLAVVALVAGLLPALRATRVDPVAALRED
jgi:putative ABC transport system permease protein